MLQTRSERQAAPLPLPTVEAGARIRFGAQSGVDMAEVLEALAGLLRLGASRGAKMPRTARIVIDLRGVELACDGVFDQPDEVQ